MVRSGCPTAANLQKLTWRPSVVPSGRHLWGCLRADRSWWDLRDPQGVREYGRYASFFLFETSGAVRKLHRREAVAARFENPKILASRTSRPPILPVKSQVLDTSAQPAHGPKTCPRGGGRTALPGNDTEASAIRAAAKDSTHLGLPIRSLNRRNFCGGSRPPRKSEIFSQEVQKDRRASKGSRGSRCRLRARQLLSLEGNIFGFGPPKTKMRSSLPPSVLLIFL